MRSILAAAVILVSVPPASLPAAPCTDYGNTIRWVRGLTFGPPHPNSHYVRGLEIADDTAYLAATYSGLLVFSLADPFRPVQVTGRGHAGAVLDVRRSGDLLALAVWGDRDSIVLYDISDPGSPRRQGSVSFPSAYGVTVLGFDGDRMVVNGRRDGIHVLDVSNPLAPVDLGLLDPSSHFTDFVFVSHAPSRVAYAASWDHGIAIYDFSTPFPTRRGELAGPWTHVTREPGADHAFAAGVTEEGDVFVSSLDISDPLRPRVIDTVKPGCARSRCVHRGGWPFVKGITAAADRVIVNTYGGYVLVDASNPAALERRGAFAGPQGAVELELHGDVIYAAEDIRGLHVYAIDSFETPEPLGRLLVDDTVGDPDIRLEDIEVIGNLAFLAEYVTEGDYYDFRAWWQLEVVDLSTPHDPTSINVIETKEPFPIAKLHEVDGALYASWAHRVHSMSLEDPRRPEPLGTVSISGPQRPTITDLAVVGARVFASGRRTPTGALVEFDFSDPTAPEFVGMTPIPGRALAIAVSGDYAYLASAEIGITMMDLTVSPPALIGYVGTGGVASDIEIQGDVAYVALGVDSGRIGRAEVAVLDLGDPAWPTVRRLVAVPHAAVDLELHGDYLYVAAERDGLIVLDARDPFASIVRGGIATGTSPSLVRLSGGHLVAASSAGFDVLAVECAARRVSVPAPGPPEPEPVTLFAQPTRDGAELAFRLSSEEVATLTVYDVTGRRVRDLQRARLSPGDHRLTWDGRDDGGRRVAAGVYFLRLRTERRATTAKVVVSR
jgi:hypothetical protein